MFINKITYYLIKYFSKYINKNKLILLIIFIFLIIKFHIIILRSNFPSLLFINNCYNDILTNKTITIESQHPKISVIIPIYNAEKYLHYSLRSVQNQKMKDIEIIIVDDNSKDDSIKLIHHYMENDKRIRLIENKINRKILFSKSIGALNSKGKYIIELDQDDMFIRDDAFDIIYNESEKYALDFLSFGYISSKNVTKKIRLINNFVKEKNIIIKQPDLKFSIFKIYNGLLWGNLIKANLYKKVIYYLWPIIINYKIIFQEDFLITFFILIYAEKAKKIEKKIFFNYHNKKSISKTYKNKYESSLSIIFVGNIFYDYYIEQNQKDIQAIINYIDFMSIYLKKGKDLHQSFFDYLFEKILSNAYLPKKIKNSLMKTFNLSKHFNSIKNLNASSILEISSKSQKQNEQLIKISIIIICSNFESVKNIINSINNQNFEYFEIILIFDDDNEKIYNLLKNYIKSYQNIRIINNEGKKGYMFSIIKGVKVVKGKYIMILNQNCFFLERGTLNDIYREVEEKRGDILEFNLYKLFNNYPTLYRCHHFNSQFNLTQIKYNLLFDNADISKELLTNKLIKSNYLLELVTKYKLQEIKIVIEYFNDNIFNFIINENYHKFIKTNSNSTSIYINEKYEDKIKFDDFSTKNIQLLNESIFYINFIFDFSKNTIEAKEMVIQEFFKFLSIIFNKFTDISTDSLKLIQKFLDCEYISKKNKNMLKFYYYSLIK